MQFAYTRNGLTWSGPAKAMREQVLPAAQEMAGFKGLTTIASVRRYEVIVATGIAEQIGTGTSRKA